jgi:hypothetical protein
LLEDGDVGHVHVFDDFRTPAPARIRERVHDAGCDFVALVARTVVPRKEFTLVTERAIEIPLAAKRQARNVGELRSEVDSGG